MVTGKRRTASRLATVAAVYALAATPSWAMERTAPAQLGPRPFYLVDTMRDGPLKDRLQACASRPDFRARDFSISHRGAPMQFPEHTREGVLAASRMGAGIIECDVTFTRDRELVCRHSQCDLHTTTDILLRPDLAAKCTKGFQPADPATGRKASAQCCTSDLTLAEFKTLAGKMDAGDPDATSVAAYLDATPRWRTDLYAGQATLMSHREYIALVRSLGRKFAPELKAPQVPMPFQSDFTQERYAQKLVDEYRQADVNPKDVFAQSFQLGDVLYWISVEPAFGEQAVLLDGRDETDKAFDPGRPETWKPGMTELAATGVRILAPPLWMLVRTSEDGGIEPSVYAIEAKKAGLGLITWSVERSGPLASGGGYYYQSLKDITRRDGDVLDLLHVLHTKIGVRGVFSDWPATTTFYANCVEAP